MTGAPKSSSGGAGCGLRPDSVVARGDVPSADIDEEVVVLSLEMGKYYGLDDIGAEIWRRLRSPVRVRDLCTALAADYDADAATITRDVLALLTKLADVGLITVVS